MYNKVFLYNNVRISDNRIFQPIGSNVVASIFLFLYSNNTHNSHNVVCDEYDN